MPIYSFACMTCGEFTDMRSMDRADEDAACPLCGSPAPRTVSAPYIWGRGVNPLVRHANERNERSAHEPRVVSRQQWQCEAAAPTQSRLHGAGLCNCCVTSSFGRR